MLGDICHINPHCTILKQLQENFSQISKFFSSPTLLVRRQALIHTAYNNILCYIGLLTQNVFYYTFQNYNHYFKWLKIRVSFQKKN